MRKIREARAALFGTAAEMIRVPGAVDLEELRADWRKAMPKSDVGRLQTAAILLFKR